MRSQTLVLFLLAGFFALKAEPDVIPYNGPAVTETNYPGQVLADMSTPTNYFLSGTGTVLWLRTFIMLHLRMYFQVPFM